MAMIYELLCEECCIYWECQLSFAQVDKIGRYIACPQCNKRKCVRQYWENKNVRGFVYNDPTTVGHQADRNTKKMGKYELEARRKADFCDIEGQKKHRQNMIKKINPDVKFIEPKEPWFGKLPQDKQKVFTETSMDKSHVKNKQKKIMKYIMTGQ